MRRIEKAIDDQGADIKKLSATQSFMLGAGFVIGGAMGAMWPVIVPLVRSAMGHP